MGDVKKISNRPPWQGLSMGVVFVGIRGRLNLSMEVNDSADFYIEPIFKSIIAEWKTYNAMTPFINVYIQVFH